MENTQDGTQKPAHCYSEMYHIFHKIV